MMPKRELRSEANVLEIIHCDPFCLETSNTLCSPSCPPSWPPESCQFVRTEEFFWVWSLWKQLQGLCFSRDSETCRRTQHQRVASTGSFQCTIWSLIKQNRRSCDSQKGLSGLRDVRQENGKSSGLCAKVWYGWISLQIKRAGWEEVLWMTQKSLA